MLLTILVCIVVCALSLASTQTCNEVTVNIASSPHMPNGVVNIEGLPNVLLFCTPINQNPYIWQLNETTESSVTNDQWNVIAPQVGDYRCGFHVNNCGVVYSSKIIFAIPPTIDPIPNVSVNETNNFQLVCEITGGYPTPSVNWYKGTQLVGTGVSYMISSSSPSDAGQYTCVASNAVGNTNKSLTVEIISPPITITSSPVLPDMSSPTLTPSSSPDDMPQLTNDEIVGVSVISFLGLAFIIALIFLIGAFVYFIYFIRQRKTRKSVDKSRLLENDHVPSGKEPDFNATIPASPSYINEGFNADDDSASSNESEKVDTKTMPAKEESIEVTEEDSKAKELEKTEETIEIIKAEEPKEQDEEQKDEIVEEKIIEVESKSKVEQDVYEAIEQQLVEAVVEIEDAMKQQKDGKDQSNKMTSIHAPAPQKIDLPPNSNPLTPIQLRELMESVDLLALQRKDTDNPFKSDFEAIPTCAPDRDAWPAETIAKNRYLNVIPSPHSAVSLTSTGSDLSTYINANFINGYEGKDKAYIATQAPTYDTIPDFWRMVWEQNVTTIVMTCGIVEGGRNKCAKYWPPAEDNDTQTYGNVVVRNNFEETTPYYKITYLTIYPSSSMDDPSIERDVYHFWFTAWPETGVPMEPTSMLKFREAVLSCRNVLQSGPIVVHCSGGLGRTGAFILSDILIQEYEKKGTIHPLRWLAELRRARGGIVQFLDQYIFVHRLLMAYVNEHPK